MDFHSFYLSAFGPLLIDNLAIQFPFLMLLLKAIFNHISVSSQEQPVAFIIKSLDAGVYIHHRFLHRAFIKCAYTLFLLLYL